MDKEKTKQAIDRVLRQARAYKIDYGADGSVTVHVKLDLDNAWDALRGDR